MAMEDMHTLWDHLEIQTVRARIAQALDERDWPMFEDQFVDEVEVDFPEFGMPLQRVARGELRASYQRNLSRLGLRTQHLFTNFRITVTGDTAQCRSSFAGHHFLAGAESGEEWVLRGEYRDTLLRTPLGWKISSIAFRTAYQLGNPQLLAS